MVSPLDDVWIRSSRGPSLYEPERVGFHPERLRYFIHVTNLLNDSLVL